MLRFHKLTNWLSIADTTGASDARDGDDALAHGFVDLRAFGAITFESIAKLDGQRNEGPESESEPTAITEQQNENENETEEQGEQQLAAQNEALRDQELGAQQIAAPANSAVECCEVEPTQNGTWIVKLRCAPFGCIFKIKSYSMPGDA